MPYCLANGRRLHYCEEGQGPLLLVLPGNTASSVHLLGAVRHFRDAYRVVAPDFAGTGQSERVRVWPADWHERSAHDLAALLDHLGEPSCVALGASGGGVIALLLAILYPRRVRAVVADSCVESLPPAALLRNVSQRDLSDPGAARFWEQGHGADWREVVAADSDMLTRFAQGGADWFHGRLNRVLCPTLLTLSLADELLVDPGGSACRMIAQMPQSRALLFPTGAHPLMWSRAEEFHRAAADFVRGV